MNPSLTLLLLLLLKTLAVFAVSGLILLALRRASASARHLVCLLTLGALLALPLFSLTLPGWRLPVLKEPTLQEPTPARSSPPLPKREGKEEGPGLAPTLGTSSTEPLRPPVSGGPLRSEERTKQGGGFLLLYLLGVLLALLRPLLGLRGIAHLRRACVPVTDPPTLTLTDDCAAVLRLSRPVTLCQAAVPVPMTWGWRRPIVLLPTESDGWPADRTQSVLLHEMAHVKRRDWLSHRLADCVSALYWFHPFVWLTARRLRAEGEIACDDLVLASGIAAPDYARHLLDIARALPPTSPPTQSAIAMAQTSQIEGRLTMILDKTQSRRILTRRAVFLTLGISAALLVTLAVLRPTVRAQVSLPLHTAFSFSALPQSTSLSVTGMEIDGKPILAGITDADKPGSPWWASSGMLLPSPVYDTIHDTKNQVGTAGTHSVKIAIHLPAAAQGVTVEYKLPDSSGYSSDGEWAGKSRSDAGHMEAQAFASTGGARVVTAAFPSALKRTSLSVGIASGIWTEAVSNVNPSGGLSINNGGQGFIFGAAEQTPNGLALTVTTNTADDIRVVAIDTLGHTLLPVDIGSNGLNSMNQITVHFSQPIAQIKEFRVETRPFHWVEFKDVALHPAH